MKEKELVIFQQILSYLNEAERLVNRAQKELVDTFLMKGEKKALASQQAKVIEPEAEEEEVIIGNFDGENLVTEDGRKYEVPANYASKSKLVVGDLLKLRINKDGSFIFKQIQPISRLHRIGELKKERDEYKLIVDGKIYNVLTASVTYYKGSPGDKFSVLLPKDLPAKYATIDNKIV